MGWALVQKSPTVYGVNNECEREAPQREAMTRKLVEGPQEKILRFLLLVGSPNTSQENMGKELNIETISK